MEDDAFLSDLYKSQLEKAGHTVIQAFESSESISAIYDFKPDLVLLDLIMPRFTGMEVLKKIKAEKRLSSLNVIVLSNIKDNKIVNEAADLGAKGYIIKTSITPDQISEEVKKYL